MVVLRWHHHPPPPPTSVLFLERRKDGTIVELSKGTNSSASGGGERYRARARVRARGVSINLGRRIGSGFEFAAITSGNCLSASFQQVRKVGRARFSFSSSSSLSSSTSWAQHPQECGGGGGGRGGGGRGARTFSSPSAVPRILRPTTRRGRVLLLELVVVSQSREEKRGVRRTASDGNDSRVQTDEKQQQQQREMIVNQEHAIRAGWESPWDDNASPHQEQQQQQQKEMLVNQEHEIRAVWESPWDDNAPPPPPHQERQRQHTGRNVDGNVERIADHQLENVPLELEQNRHQSQEEELPAAALQIPQPSSSTARKKQNLQREMDMGVCAVQLACLLSQRTQQKVLQREEEADEKKDRSLVTVADWGVQAVVSWVLAQKSEERGKGGERRDMTPVIPMIAEEDTKGLRGRDKIDLLGRVVDAVNQCLEEAPMVGMPAPVQPLSAMDVLKAISEGSAEGGKKGRYWVLDPVDGTLGFVRGDQYAIALALLEDGEVVLAILGCPNFPLRKQWLRYTQRYYRLASKLSPPSPGTWHKGIILTTTKGAGRVMMQPLLVDPDGRPRPDEERQAPQQIQVSPIDDPSLATFCEPFEKSNSNHSFTAGLAQSLGLRNRPLRVYSLAKYAAIARGDAEIFMKFAKAGYKEKIWDHAAGVLIVQEAGGVVTDATGRPLDFSQGRFLTGLDRGIIASSGKSLHEQLLKAVNESWESSTL